MNQRDLELLDKELWGVSPNLRLERDALGLMVIVAFVGGLARHFNLNAIGCVADDNSRK